MVWGWLYMVDLGGYGYGEESEITGEKDELIWIFYNLYLVIF